MSKYWRPLTQEEIARLVEGDPLLIRQNYLWNPERRPVTYVEARYLAKVKRAVIQILEKGSDTAICVGLTEVGRLFDDGWHMTPEEWRKIKSGDVVIIHQDSRECRPARFVTGALFLLRKSFLKARRSFRRWRRERLERFDGHTPCRKPGTSLYGNHLQTKERCRDAELEVLERKITEEDPGYWHRVADRILAEAKALPSALTTRFRPR
jgi:hypothetical protein